MGSYRSIDWMLEIFQYTAISNNNDKGVVIDVWLSQNARHLPGNNISMNWQYAEPVHISSIFVYFEAKQSLIHASISWRERLSVVTDVEYTLTADCIFWISFGCCGDIWMSIKALLIVYWKRKNIRVVFNLSNHIPNNLSNG